MQLTQLIELYTQDQRVNSTYPDSQRQLLPHLIRHISQVEGGEGAIVYSQLTETTADAAIDEQIAWFTAHGQSFEWKAYDYDRPPDLVARLAARGFMIEESEAVMVLDLAHIPASLLQPPTQHVQQITTPAALGSVRAIEEAVWGGGFRWLEEYLTSALQNYPSQMSIYVAAVGNVPASAAWIYYPTDSRFASLWGGSTLEAYRSQGLYTALLAVRAQEARSRNVEYLTVDASPMSRPILEKFGFVKLAETFPCKWDVAQ